MAAPIYKVSGKRMATAEELPHEHVPVETEMHPVEDDVLVLDQGTSEDDLDRPDEMDAPVVEDIDPRAWRLMPGPEDGTLIEVKADPDQPDDEAVPAIFRRTRRRDHAARRWVPAQFWASALTSQELSFEPIVWRMLPGFATPGMVIR